ncbi:HNH endonuclease [Delftia lacustris]|uniref:HNH endonuclease n=1 Tax=Delftia lacustris TaxID=558537 RepID=UPI0035A5AD29
MRVGQSLFRVNLLNRWNFACSVTGLKNPEVLIASHIKRWSYCEKASERWDVNNGLLLTPSLDKAFDLGLIGFEHEGIHRGRLIVSAKVDWDMRNKLKHDNPQWRIRDWYQGLALLHHRQRWDL